MSIPSNCIYQKKKKFVEEVGLLIEEKGHPRIAGQIIGWLLICDPPKQSFSDLVDHLDVSKASISNMTRMLMEAGMIEKVRVSGERQIYFRIKKCAWTDLMHKELKFTRSMRDIAQKGQKILAAESETDCTRLNEMENYYSFAVEKLPALIEKYAEESFDS